MLSSSDLLTLAVRGRWRKDDRTEEALSPEWGLGVQRTHVQSVIVKQACFSWSSQALFLSIVCAFVRFFFLSLFLCLLFSECINRLTRPPCAVGVDFYLFSSRTRTRFRSVRKSAPLYPSPICVGTPARKEDLKNHDGLRPWLQVCF